MVARNLFSRPAGAHDLQHVDLAEAVYEGTQEQFLRWEAPPPTPVKVIAPTPNTMCQTTFVALVGKREFIHDNPLWRGTIDDSAHWRYCGARNDANQPRLTDTVTDGR